MPKPGGILLLGLCFYHSLLQAQNVGIYEGGIIIDGVTYSEPGISLQNRSITKTSGQKLNLTSVFLKTFKTANSAVCKGYLFYHLYPVNTTPSSFRVLDCGVVSAISGAQTGFQNQLWQNNSINTDLLRDLDTGKYFLEIYYGIDGSNNSSICSDIPTIYLKNGAEPFRALVTIVSPFNFSYTGFSTRTNNEKVFLDWQISQTVSELKYFILEKSHNGVVWSVMDTVSISGIQYFYTDNSPFTGVNFYRVRASGSEKTNYSIVRRIYVGRVENIITIYPNPVSRNLRFQMTAIIKGNYDVVIYNADGSRITASTINHDGNDNYVTIPLPGNLAKGLFWLVLYSKNEFYKRSFMIE